MLCQKAYLDKRTKKTTITKWNYHGLTCNKQIKKHVDYLFYLDFLSSLFVQLVKKTYTIQKITFKTNTIIFHFYSLLKNYHLKLFMPKYFIWNARFLLIVVISHSIDMVSHVCINTLVTSLFTLWSEKCSAWLKELMWIHVTSVVT